MPTPMLCMEALLFSERKANTNIPTITTPIYTVTAIDWRPYVWIHITTPIYTLTVIDWRPYVWIHPHSTIVIVWIHPHSTIVIVNTIRNYNSEDNDDDCDYKENSEYASDR